LSALFLVLTFILHGGWFGLRTLLAFLLLPVETVFTPSAVQAVTFIVQSGAGFLWTCGLVMLKKDRTSANLAQAKEQVSSLLAEKELLLRETHHRVKNNMATVLALLSLQASRQHDPVLSNQLEEAANRIHSMLVLYDRLYRTSDFRNLGLDAYIRPLVGQIVAAMEVAVPVRTALDLEDIPLPVAILSSLGIIINELITNSMKYAFCGREDGTIRLSASSADGTLTLVYDDDGTGQPGCAVPGIAISSDRDGSGTPDLSGMSAADKAEDSSSGGASGFGIQRVDIMVRQLSGTLRKGPGYRYTITVPLGRPSEG